MNRHRQFVAILATVTAFSLLLSKSAAAFVTTSASAFNQRPLTKTASGYRNNASGGLNNVGSNGNYWSAAVNSATNAYNLNFNSGNVNPLNNNYRASSFSVRSVRAFTRSKTDSIFDVAMTISKEELHRRLTIAYLEARHNERNKKSQLTFEINLEHNIDILCNELYERNWRPLPPVCFIIEKPVKREVFAPRFPDRIVSHLLFDMIAPLFERTFIYDSYSCRKGKGTLFGVERFEHHIRSVTDNYRNEAFILNLDIAGYFMNINKGILYNEICRTLESYRARQYSSTCSWNDVLDYGFVDYVVRQILFRSPAECCIRVGDIHNWDDLPHHKSLFYSPLGTGLTIGDLTSQLFSNIYLNPFDQFMKREMKLQHYCRYVDDSRALHSDKHYLEECISAADEYLQHNLKLHLHPDKCNITSTRESAFFLGAYCREHRRFASNKTVANFRTAVHDMEFTLACGAPTVYIDYYQKALSKLNSYLGYFSHFDEFRNLDNTLRDSSLKNTFVFARNYSQAKFRPEIKQFIHNSLISW